MRKKTFLTICVLVSSLAIGYCQIKIVTKKDRYLPNSWEEFGVLNADRSVREGTYRRIICNTLTVEGSYKNGEKDSIWKAYSHFGNVELEINYNTGAIKYLTRDSLTKSDIFVETQLIPVGDRPVLNTTSSNMIAHYLIELLQYPDAAAERWIQGKVLVAVKVNSKGEITDYTINTSVQKYLDKEALRVVKLIPLEFLPAYKDGEPVDSEFIIPFRFILK